MLKTCYIIQTRTGSEISTAKRLMMLNERYNGMLFTAVYVPLKNEQVINVNDLEVSNQITLAYHSYIFIEATELTDDVYYLLKRTIGTILSILDKQEINLPIYEEIVVIVDTDDKNMNSHNLISLLNLVEGVAIEVRDKTTKLRVFCPAWVQRLRRIDIPINQFKSRFNDFLSAMCRGISFQ